MKTTLLLLSLLLFIDGYAQDLQSVKINETNISAGDSVELGTGHKNNGNFKWIFIPNIENDVVWAGANLGSEYAGKVFPIAKIQQYERPFAVISVSGNQYFIDLQKAFKDEEVKGIRKSKTPKPIVQNNPQNKPGQPAIIQDLSVGDQLIVTGHHIYTGIVLTLIGSVIDGIGVAIYSSGSNGTPVMVLGGAVNIVGVIYSLEAPSHLIKAGKKMNDEKIGF